MEKKKLLLIGNNELSDDFSSIINEYDMVVRVNRMTNYENCKGKTDLWLCDVHPVAAEVSPFNIQGRASIIGKINK